MVGDDETESRDHSIELPASQDALIEAVARANPRTIVVLKSGSALLMPWLKDVPAVLEAWYPGEEDGNAVADVLLGKVNPSGKLPLTFPQTVADTLAKSPDQFPGDGTTVHYSDDLEVGYRAVNAQHLAPLFPFGFGLSYTSFRFDDLTANVTPGKPEAVVRFGVINTGKRAGDEVAQIYLTYPSITEGDEPPRQLKGFQKVFLQPGELRTIEMKLNARTFSFWSVNAHKWQVVPGEFKIFLGDSSANLPLSGVVEIHSF
jgi:beta-glucosidase